MRAGSSAMASAPRPTSTGVSLTGLSGAQPAAAHATRASGRENTLRCRTTASIRQKLPPRTATGIIIKVRWLIAVCGLVCAGCYSPIGELTATHVEAGGAVTAALDAGAESTTKAIADGTAQPMTIEGTSPALVFGLVFGADDLTGMPATAQLLGGHAVQMTVTAQGSVQLSVHMEGRSCAAGVGTVVHLTPDGKGHVDGDFSGAGTDCQMAGSLSGIPIDQ